MRYGARVAKKKPGGKAAAEKKEQPAGEGPRLVLKNVRCFAHAVVPLHGKVTVIIGQNGSGKTSIAEAIASLAPGDGEGLDEFPLRQGATSGSMALYGEGAEPIATWTHAAGKSTRRRLDQRVFVYGQYRALRPPTRRGGDAGLLRPEFRRAELRPLPDSLADARERSTTGTLFHFDEHRFRDLAAFAALLHDEGATNPAARASWEGFREWLTRLDVPIDRVEIHEHEGRRRAAFQRASLTLPITELSDGYRAVLAVVLDLVIRYSQIFAPLDNPLTGEATVVIDEIDLNLHPRWQRRVIEQLTALFPETRFVLTTHSPAVVQAAIDKKRQILLLDETPDGTLVHPLKKGEFQRLDGAEIDSVLVEVFGLPSRYSPKYEEMEREAARLGEMVEGGTATREDRQKLLGLLDELQGLMARDDELKRSGPLMSEIARVQIGLLRILEAKIPGEKGGADEAASAKRR